MSEQQSTHNGTAGVIARPPLLFLAALLLGFASDHLLRLPFPVARTGWVHWVSAINAGALIVMGIAVFVYLGIGLVVRSPSILLLAVPLAITIHYGVVVREEAYLERRFGDAYREYKARVGRWL